MKSRYPITGFGFTLIEVLSAVAVIGILIAILIPALSESRERTNSTQCLSNLRQTGVALALYTNDNGGMYPYGNRTEGKNWAQHAQEYFEHTENDTRHSSTRCPARLPQPQSPGMNYSANPQVLVDSTVNASPVNTAAILRPSEIFIITEGTINNFGQSGWGVYGQPNVFIKTPSRANEAVPVADVTKANAIAWPHNKGSTANFLFADGHTSSLSKGELKQRNVQIDY